MHQFTLDKHKGESLNIMDITRSNIPGPSQDVPSYNQSSKFAVPRSITAFFSPFKQVQEQLH